ncbi:hypothetical protein GCM10028803_31460 [Larkinella knui]
MIAIFDLLLQVYTREALIVLSGTKVQCNTLVEFLMTRTPRTGTTGSIWYESCSPKRLTFLPFFLFNIIG